jgi:hypothetical protein
VTAFKVTKPIAFQTGRWYTNNGQRIAAELTPEGGILFCDVDRDIRGYFDPDTVKAKAMVLDQTSVMTGYDYRYCDYWCGIDQYSERLQVLKQLALAVPAPKETQ